jgi:Tfp pilus assembly protein PilN
MFKQLQGWAVIASILLVAGCATTGRNNRTDLDALNARITALQGELAEKDAEIAKLKNGLEEQKGRREAAEAALKQAEDDRRALLDSKRSKEPESDLK